jgi:hypothetical protein
VSDLINGVVFAYRDGKRLAQEERRDWRTATRTTKPLSTKIKFPSGKVDVVPAPKKAKGK